MNYDLNKATDKMSGKLPVLASLRKLVSIISGERRNLIIAFTAIFLNAGLSLAGPYIVGYTIDNHVQAKDYHGVLFFAGLLLVMYVLAFAVNYAQIAHDGRYMVSGCFSVFGIRFSIS
jgi:ATP-binding cassette subfamily B protein